MNTNQTLSPYRAMVQARHYLSHTTDGWDGYSLDEVADRVGQTMVDFLEGTLTFERDVAPMCDEWCV